MGRACFGVVALLVLPAFAGCVFAPTEPALRVGSTTSTQDSGILDVLLATFRRDTGVRAVAIVAGTGQMLATAARGDVDVLLTHSPDRETAFLEKGLATRRVEVMTNRFLIVGPAPLTDATTATEAFARIADEGALFASRADASGTHDKELALWAAAGRRLEGSDRAWYKELGSGQAATLRYADERGAYALTDEATWATIRANGGLTRLAVIVADDPLLKNVYAVMPVAGSRHAQAAESFADWLTQSGGQSVIADFTVGGARVFDPAGDA